MRLPIFVDDNGDLMAFDTVEDACRYLEPIDVEEGVYVAYDASGRLLQLTVAPSKSRPRQEAVFIQEAEFQSAQDVALRQLLEARLRAVGVHAEGIELEELVRLAWSEFSTR